MKVVALHTDFRIYWAARWRALNHVLRDRGDELVVIEIAGKGSPYSFASQEPVNDLNWIVLFKDASPEELTGKDIESELFPTLEDIKPDIIMAGAIAFPSGALAVKWGQKHGTRIIIFDDSKNEFVQRSRFVNYIKKCVYSGVEAMFYPAPGWQKTGEEWGFKSDSMFYGVDVVDNEFWSRTRTDTTADESYFIAVGRQVPTKNFPLLIRSYFMYKTTIGRESYKLKLVGEGPEREKIENEVRDNELENEVEILSFKGQEELNRLFQNARALCVSSYSEPWGLVLNEAMASGCPVIATEACGATDVLIEEGITGYKCRVNDVESLATKMIQFHKLGEYRQSLMRQACIDKMNAWGLEKFASSGVAAIDYVTGIQKRKVSLIKRIIISLWRGQYRPV